jgi:hypothetical protein
MILQLNPTIPLTTPNGEGRAVALIDYGEDHDLKWVVIQTDTGEIWTWNNDKVRGVKNITLGRTCLSKIQNED